MTSLDLPAIRALLAGATPGPWEFVGADLESCGVPWASVIESTVDCMSYCYGGSVRQEVKPEDAAFITAAPSIVTQLLAVVERVEGLHTPVKKWEPYEGAGYSFATREQALEASGEVDLNSVAIEAGPQFFEVCKECSRVEGEQLAEIGEEWGYRESLWPCPTIQAITGEGQ